MVLFYAVYVSLAKGSVIMTSSRLQIVSLSAFVIGFYILVFQMRDTSEFVSGRWLRKILGAFTVFFIALYFIVNKNFRYRNEVPMLIIAVSMLTFFYSELRFSMLTAATAPLVLYLLHQNKEQFAPSERWLLNIFFWLFFSRSFFNLYS